MSEKELPTGWALATLGEVASWGSGGTPKSGVPHYYGGDIPWIVSGDLKDQTIQSAQSTITAAGLGSSSAKWVPQGSVLIAMYGATIGKLGIAGISLTTNQAVAFATPFEGLIDSRFLFWYLRSQRESFRKVGKGGAQPNISQTILKAWSVPIPPLAEQHRIVEALEGHLSRLDAAASNVARCELRIPKLEGAIRGRFTGSLSESVELPDGWRWGNLEDVLARIEAGKSFRCEPRPARDQEWGVIKVSAMTWGEFRVSEQKAVPVGKEFDRRHEIKEGDILVSRANTADYVGAPVIVKQTRPRLLLSDKSLRLVPAPGVNKAWLITALASPYVRQQISARATGTKDSMRNISQRELAAVRIPIPPAAEQRHIADQVDAHLLASGRFSAEMRQVKARSKKLRASLLDSAFSGALVPQDPADEPAVALLARIQADRAAHPKAKRARRTPAVAPKAKAPEVSAPAPSPTPAPAHSVQQEFDL
ncbi:restriction endonuclease subunit S [Streptomyces sp. NPDC005494]|uniref:restriction endonuclease subunit S n=1 Tax=Streptomyces sp. NPDC005494 TaxID=3364715 RepID=UPI003690457B